MTLYAPPHKKGIRPMSENSTSSSHYKLFCDESCHLEHDNSDVMVLGTICCSEEHLEEINRQIKILRYRHNYKTELKWTKQQVEHMVLGKWIGIKKT